MLFEKENNCVGKKKETSALCKFKRNLVLVKSRRIKHTHQPRRTLKEDGENEVRSEHSFIKSMHSPWKPALLNALSCGNIAVIDREMAV